ncbi:hypothetical protein HD599_000925 [Conyzicola lurida]|uniref:Lipoprotein n=1 Tax=Conyzicola lurida TaxID=1172621 RepID=A0A841AKW4_9MICO|nr:hypothetical protein [Conyzicola lurida]MBB5842602.1 hypothetical protein [Conyzicola lurida]
MNRARTALAGSALAVLLLSGCTAGPADPAPAAEQNSVPTETGAVGCDDLVSDADVTKYTDAGWELIADFVQRETESDSPRIAFVEYGGALCMWGPPASDFADVLAASPITDEQAAAERARLEADGFTLDQHNGVDRYALPDPTGGSDTYLFSGGHWFYANTPEAADRIRAQLDVG